jgi:hypothetical protein
MGEYADMALDMALNAEEYYRDHPEEFDDGPDGMIVQHGPLSRRPPQIKTCWYCGVGGLIWQHSDGGWRLSETETGAVHVCVEYPGIESLRGVKS